MLLFLNYFPALILLDPDTPWKWLGLATPLVAAIVVASTARLWNKALNRCVGH